jgi:hypothetical protein
LRFPRVVQQDELETAKEIREREREISNLVEDDFGDEDEDMGL